MTLPPLSSAVLQSAMSARRQPWTLKSMDWRTPVREEPRSLQRSVRENPPSHVGGSFHVRSSRPPAVCKLNDFYVLRILHAPLSELPPQA